MKHAGYSPERLKTLISQIKPPPVEGKNHQAAIFYRFVASEGFYTAAVNKFVKGMAVFQGMLITMWIVLITVHNQLIFSTYLL